MLTACGPARAPRLAPRARRGLSLIELLVALSVGGLAFGAFALVVAQQERAHAELARRIRARAQLREGLSPLVGELRAVSPAVGDITADEARDSSLEFRSTIGAAVVCEVRDRSIVAALASFATAPQPGDTLWAYAEADGTRKWEPLLVAGVSAPDDVEPWPCAFPATAAGATAARRSSAGRYALSLETTATPATPPGTPLRVTRRVRYSLYRAPDRRWYLGRREWSPARNGFETIQPVSGPYRGYASADRGESGVELRYFDGAGAELPAGSPTTGQIARLTITLRAPPPPLDRVIRERRDVASAVVAFRSTR